VWLLVFASAAAGCSAGVPREEDGGDTSSDGGPLAAEGGSRSADGGASGGACARYIECLERVAPEIVGAAKEAYGPDSTCQKVAPAYCEEACARATALRCPPPVHVVATSGYDVSCLTILSLGDASKVYRFRGSMAWRSDDSVTLELTVKARGGALTSARASGEGKVDRGGRAEIRLGDLEVPVEASLSGKVERFEALYVRAKPVLGASFCAGIGGSMVSPIGQPLDETTNVCLFVPHREGMEPPLARAEDYVCDGG